MGALKYLTFTRPKITYVVQQVCLFMHDPREKHLHILRCIIRYLYGIQNHGLQLFRSPFGKLTAYSDADWADILTRDGQHPVIVYLGELNLMVFEKTKKLFRGRVQKQNTEG